MKIAIYPGSFDPITNGHLNIIERASRIFDKLIVCVMFNHDKRAMFTQQERVEMIQRAAGHLPNVEVDCSEGLLADYAKARGSCVVIKGLRAGSDFEKEFQMSLINRKLNPELDTMFLPARQNFTYLSSSVVKEMARYQVSLSGFVPDEIAGEVQDKMNELLKRSQS